LDKIPVKTITKVKSFFGDEITNNLKLVPINPLLSAIQIPSIDTSTVPNGAKEVKLVTIFVKIKAKASLEIKLKGLISSPVAGCVAENPIADTIQDNTTTKSDNKKNKVAGCGNVLPAFSIILRNLSVKFLFSFIIKMF